MNERMSANHQHEHRATRTGAPGERLVDRHLVLALNTADASVTTANGEGAT